MSSSPNASTEMPYSSCRLKLMPDLVRRSIDSGAYMSSLGERKAEGQRSFGGEAGLHEDGSQCQKDAWIKQQRQPRVQHRTRPRVKQIDRGGPPQRVSRISYWALLSAFPTRSGLKGDIREV